MADHISIKLTGRAEEPALPAVLGSASRAADGQGDDFLPRDYLRATGTYDVGAAARSIEGGAALERDAQADEVVVLELADGSTLITSAERLRDALARSRPDWLGARRSHPLREAARRGCRSRNAASAKPWAGW